MNDKLADEPNDGAAILKAAADLLGDQISKHIDSLQHTGCCHCHCHCHSYQWGYPWSGPWTVGYPTYPPTVTWCGTTTATATGLNTVTIT